MINAIHCAIAAADAFCIKKKGLRHAGDRHSEAVQLFLSVNPSDDNLKKATNRLSRLLDIKTDAEYGEQLASKREAEEAKRNAEQVIDFVKSQMQ